MCLCARGLVEGNSWEKQVGEYSEVLPFFLYTGRGGSSSFICHTISNLRYKEVWGSYVVFKFRLSPVCQRARERERERVCVCMCLGGGGGVVKYVCLVRGGHH